MGKPIAFVLCAGNGPPNEFPGTVRFKNYVEAALAVGPQIQEAKIDRVLYHNPGGNFFLGWSPNIFDIHNPTAEAQAKLVGVDTRSMWINQWPLAKQAKCRYANDKHLIFGHQLLRDYFDIKEVIYYLGSPETLVNAAKEGPDCVEAFKRCGKGVSFGFDATAWHGARIKPNDDVCAFFESLRKDGYKVYVEPRFSKEQADAGLGTWVDGTIAADIFDTGPNFKPDLTLQPGEIIRGPIDRSMKLPSNVTAMVHDGVGLNWGKPK